MIALTVLMLFSAPSQAPADLRNAAEAMHQALLEQNTQSEIDYCDGEESYQPFAFCLADQRTERGKRELKSLLPKIRAAALSQRKAIAEFTKQVGGVTLGGDPVAAFERSQKLWEKSSAADCGVMGLSQATGNAGTRGVAAQLECEADRTFERIEFLRRTYEIED